MRLIDADALLKDINENYDLNYGETLIDPCRFAELVEAAPTIEQPTWISVEDRLPIESGKYLVVREYSAWERSLRDISIEYYSAEFEGWFFDATKLLGVTHWMPLPELPKGG